MGPMITIWNSLVRPCLDYCSPVWSPIPSNFHEIDLLEEIQRSFTRQIDGMEGLDYAQHLKKLHMYSIQRRNERFKIIYIYKIKENLVPNVSSKYGLYFKTDGRYGCLCKMPNSVLEVERGRLETALSPGPRVICGTRSLSVSGILPE